jgi:hypothetical protein
MSQTRQGDPSVPAKVTEVQFEPVQERERDPFWDDDNARHGRVRPPLSFSGRMFNVGWKGWTRLVIVCLIVGAVFQAGGFNPFAPGFTIGGGLGQIVNGVLNIAGWAAQNGGLPLILGALAVLPFWVLWRAVVTLFNRDKPPGPDDRILPKERPRKSRQL